MLRATLRRLRSVNDTSLRSQRKFDHVGVIVSLGCSHPYEGEVNKIISEGLIVSQFSQTSAFAYVGGVVVGGPWCTAPVGGSRICHRRHEFRNRRAMKLDCRR
jgi:hypothetical protein